MVSISIVIISISIVIIKSCATKVHFWVNPLEPAIAGTSPGDAVRCGAFGPAPGPMSLLENTSGARVKIWVSILGVRGPSPPEG